MLKRFGTCSAGLDIGCVVLMVFFLLAIGEIQGAPQEPVQVALLLDASGSMSTTDQQGYSKLAAELIVSLLGNQDEVAIVEFAEKGRIVAPFQSASQKAALIHAINQVGRSGLFTDFCAGLQSCLELFSPESKGERRIIVLFTDGILDPDPSSDLYAPYNLEYRMAMLGRGREARKNIQARYRGIVAPIAERIISEELAPKLRSANIELFTIGFSDSADRPFLARLADKTSREPLESHFFFAQQASDLAKVFLTLLQYIQNRSIVFSDQGTIRSGTETILYLDSYLRDLTLIGITDEAAMLSCRTGSAIEQPLGEAHPQLQLIDLIQKTPPGEWTFGYRSGAGPYSIFLLGKSLIDFELQGLAGKYLYGESIDPSLRILGPDGKPLPEKALSLIDASAEIRVAGQNHARYQGTLRQGSYQFHLRAEPLGCINLLFTLRARDEQGREILPRPSRQYRTLVMPRFNVEPEEYELGDVKRGTSVAIKAVLHNGLDETSRIDVTSAILHCNRGLDPGRPEPAIQRRSVSMPPFAVMEQNFELAVPGKAKWGYYEGEIVYSIAGRKPLRQPFRLHIPSIWETLTIGLAVFLILALIALVIFMVCWWRLKRPVGVLRPLAWPTGAAVDQMKLSQVKRGFFRRHLSRRKNILLLASYSREIRLEMLPPGMAVELIFYRFGADYIHYLPGAGLTDIIEVTSPDFGSDFSISLEPGKRLHLENGCTIKISEYLFEYTNS